jgi:hypothetical protein
VTNNKGLHAYLSPEGREALGWFSEEHGVSFSGLVEALAQAIVEGHDLTFLVELARRVDAGRRRRG